MNNIVHITCLTLLAGFSLGVKANSSKQWINENITFIGVNTLTPQINTEFKMNADKDSERDVEFQTNTNSVYNHSIGTKYFDLSISTSSSSDDEIKTTNYQDFYLKTHVGDFELTFHSAKYEGGNINEGPLTKDDYFFEDYTVKKTNYRGTYYLDTQFNKVLTNPKLAREIRSSQNKNYYDSWNFTLGYDQSQTNFPNLSQSEVQGIFNLSETKANYMDYLETETLYFGLGYSGLHMLTENFTYHFKFSFGNGNQNSKYGLSNDSLSHKGTSRYVESDIGCNYIIGTSHNIGFITESYTHSTDIEGNTIDSRASQISLFYKYLI